MGGGDFFCGIGGRPIQRREEARIGPFWFVHASTVKVSPATTSRTPLAGSCSTTCALSMVILSVAPSTVEYSVGRRASVARMSRDACRAAQDARTVRTRLYAPIRGVKIRWEEVEGVK